MYSRCPTSTKCSGSKGFTAPAATAPPTYDVVIYDSATSTSYFLRIPTNYTSTTTGKGELTVKLGHPYLEAKFYMHATAEDQFVIPKEIREAAEHKLAEIADYLSRPAAQP